MPSLISNYQEELIEVGCDEVGRGCLAGPVVAAAVILPKDYTHPLLNDSKKVTEKNRLILEEDIKKNALAYGIGIVSEREIDDINVLNASFLAMHRAIDQLQLKPEFILVDGNRFNKYKNLPHQCVIKGDCKYLNIAAASIIAKTYRDNYMVMLDHEYPYYDWKNNKGYPTKKHRSGILEKGTSPFHRTSFKLLADNNQKSILF